MIDKDSYSRIHSLLPIACIDLVIVRTDAVLLVKRKNEPLKDNWFIPGGRLHRGEFVQDAIERIAKEETGLTVSRAAVFLIFENLIFDADPFGHGLGTHKVSLAFATKTMIEGEPLKLDMTQHDEARWYKPEAIINGGFHHYMTRAVRLCFEQLYV